MKRSIWSWPVAMMGIAALVILAWPWLSGDQDDVDRPSRTASVSGTSAPSLAAAQTDVPGAADPGAAPVAVADSSSEKSWLHDQARLERQSAAADGLTDLQLEGPRPMPGQLDHDAMSRVERTMSAGELAYQTERMVTALEDRATRVQHRLEQARQEGDADEVRRQEMIHWRLISRVATLNEEADELSHEAEQETLTTGEFSR